MKQLNLMDVLERVETTVMLIFCFLIAFCEFVQEERIISTWIIHCCMAAA